MEKKNKTRLARAAMTLLFALLTTVGAWAQTTVTIGDGTSTSNICPFSTYWNYSITEQLYTADEIGMAGTISSISFYYDYTTVNKQYNITVYMQNVDAEDLSTGISLADADEVFSGTISINSQGWVTIDLDTPFAYDGTSNLLIGINKTGGSTWFSGTTWRYTSATKMARYSQNDNSAYNTSTTPATAINNRPNIQMVITPGSGATCAKPSTFEVSNITSSGADFAWEDTGAASYAFEYKKASDSEWIVVTGLTSNTYSLSTLASGTAYNARVKAVCGTDLESGYKSTNFATECSTITSFPWSEDFEGYSATTGLLPTCWSRINEGTNTYYNQYPYIYNYTAHSGSNILRFYSSGTSGISDQYAILPAMEDLTGKQIKLFARGYNSGNAIKIGLMTDPSDVSTFTEIATQTLTTSYEEYEFILTGTGNYVAIKMEAPTSSTTIGAYIDDITIREAPTCLKPTNVELTVFGQNATVTWGTDASWTEMVLSTDPEVNKEDIQNQTSLNHSAGDPYTLEYSDLAIGDYYFWIRSACGGDDVSEWIGPITFHVGYCTPTPSSRDGKGITKVSFGIGDNAVNNIDETNGLPATAPFYGDYTSMIGSVQAGVESTVAITYATGSGTVYSYGTIIWVDWDNSLSFEDNEIVYTGTSAQGSGGTPQVLEASFVVPATQALGDYRMRIAGADSYFDNYIGGNATANHSPCFSSSYAVCHDYTLRVLEAPSCLTPTGLTASNVTAHEATITWTSDADAWQIQLGENEAINVNEATYTFTGLTAETAYSVKVRTNCDGTYSEWTNPVSFTTGIACTAPTGVTASNIAGHSATLTWDYEEGDVFEYALAQNVVKDGNAKVPSDLQYQTVSAIPLTLTGLDPETEYVFYLRKNCGSEDGYSQTVTTTFTTTVACPTPTVSVSNITTTTAVVSCTNTDAVYFNVSLDELLIGESVTMPYTVTGLTANTGYYVKVQAICGEDEESDWTNPVNFITAEECPDGMVCIGTGTSTNIYVPTYTYYNHSLTQQIYTAAELGEAGAYLSVDFRTGNANGTTRSLDIYMVSTDKETFSGNTDWIAVTDADKVFSGNVTFTANDWTTIEFDAPFIYDGTSNVVLVVDDNTESYDNNYPNFYAFNATSQAIRVYSDGTNYDPTAPSSYTGTVLNVKNRVRFAIGEPPASPKPTGLTVTNITSTSATISWNGNSDTYNVYLNKEVATPLFGEDFDGENIPDDFSNDETYPWTIVEGYIKSGNAGEASSTSAISVNKNFAARGTIEFDAECRGEGTSTIWDKCIFSIDGTAMFTYGANVTGWKHYSFPVTEGEHTFTWSYKKDSSTDPTGDYFAVDNIELNETFETSATTFEDVTETAVNPTGLDPETNYIVAVEGVLGGNTSESAVLHFTTLGEATINFAAEGYATYYNRVRDVVLPAGMKAKIVSGGSTTLNYAEVENVVPAGTAILLQVYPPVGNQPLSIYLARPSVAPIGVTNMLHGSDVELDITTHSTYSTDNYYYMLSYGKEGTDNANVIGWYWANETGAAFTNGAHKAWLALPKNSGAPFLGLPGWEETTGIVPVGVNSEDGEWYTLQGLKIGKKPTTKGVYIHNGKKVLIP